ncbi:MAG: NfeD family protein [Acidobacteriales bacterium]|nr:NfeD family protein [Terriglobales bacterium]
MSSLFSQFSAFTVFLGIAAIGFVFLLVSLVLGELFEHVGDTAFEHEHDLGHGGPSFFSARIMSVFITAFGGFGAIATNYGYGVLPSSGVGFASGLFFASIIYAFARFLYGQQASSEVRTDDIVGRQARVIVAIPAGGVGQVRCQIGEDLVDKIARASDGGPVPENTAVKVEAVLGETVVVSRQ